MDPDKKVALALPLSSNDIQELRKDPNSIVSKTERDCEFDSAIKKACLNKYLETLMLENYLNAKLEEAAERDAAAHKDEKVRPTPSHVQEQTKLTQIPPQTALQNILSISQDHMNSLQLAAHHQQLMSHFNSQVMAALGPQIHLNGRSLFIPPTTAPSTSIAQVLSVNPSLANEIQQDSIMQKALAVYHTKMESGPLNVLNEVRNILNHNGIDTELTLKERMELIKLIDRAGLSAQENNPELLDALLKNNSRAVELFVKAAEAEYRPNAQAMAVNPLVSNDVHQENMIEKTFAVYQAKIKNEGTFDAANVINEVRNILTHNGIDLDDFPLKERMELNKLVDKVAVAVKDNKPEAIEKLLNANSKVVSLFIKATEAEYKTKIKNDEDKTFSRHSNKMI